MSRRLAVTLLLLGATPAAADHATKIGLSAAGGTAAFPAETHPGVLGSRLTAGITSGRFGLVAEGSVMALTRTIREGGAWVGLSARLGMVRSERMFRAMDGSLSPVIYGLDVEAIVQREWWDFEDVSDPRDARRLTYGVGLAAFAGGRGRGRGLCDVRLDVRLLWSSPEAGDGVSARMLGEPSEQQRGHDIGIVVALGTELGLAH